MGQIYICRHGETSWSLSGQHTGKKTDLSLTARGQEQAALLRKRLEAIDFEAIFCSPLQRAIESAQGLNPHIDPLLVEWDYGDYEGLTGKQIKEQNPHWNLFRDGALQGESAAQVGQRADQFLQKLSSYKGNILIFSHGHFLRVLTARFLHLKAEMGHIFALSVASLGILGFEKGEPVLMLWNDTHHLGN